MIETGTIISGIEPTPRGFNSSINKREEGSETPKEHSRNERPPEPDLSGRAQSAIEHYFLVLPLEGLLAAEPVVLEFGTHCADPILSFSHAAIVSYLQFMVVPGPFRQNFPFVALGPAADAGDTINARAAAAAAVAMILRILISPWFPSRLLNK